MSQIEPRRDPANDFQMQVFAAARKALVAMYGSQQGQKAAARVALAFVAAARTAKNPDDLYRCSAESIQSCIAASAETDIYPGGPYPRVWLVPRGGKLQWEINHRGIAALAQRAGYSIRAVPVHVDDPVLVLNFGEVVEHDSNPDTYPTSLQDLRGVYVIVSRLSDGAIIGRPWVPVALIRKRAESGQAGPVWRAWPVEMAQKTAIKWCMARGTVVLDSPEIDTALGAEIDAIDTTAEPAPSARQQAIAEDVSIQPERETVEIPAVLRTTTTAPEDGDPPQLGD